jgi:hypothetical protein
VSGPICPACQAAIRTAHAALDVLGAENASEATRQIAAEELARAGDHLRPPIGLRADQEPKR